MNAQFRKLDGIIGTLLGSKDVKLNGIRAKRRADGSPADMERHNLFMILANHLESVYFPPEKDRKLGNR